MDSGNSGSVKSSSGGSEEFDSRADSISAFFNSNPSRHIGQPPPVMSQSMLFDPLSNYFDRPLASTMNQNSQHNLVAVLSKNTRSDPNCTDLGGFMSPQQAQSRATFSSVQTAQGPESGTKASVSGTTDQQPNNNNMVRNSKKRSRASRRAPTTVLTTDTINFRAMVQEFTGIPAPPFTSLPVPRTRLDLFGTSSTMRPTQLDLTPSSPHYVLRPFAQKLRYPPPFTTSSSSMVDVIASTPSTNSTSSTTSINYQLPSELGLLKQQLPQNPLNNISMQNPILNFVSLLSNSTGSSDIPSKESPLKMDAVFDEFGLSQGYGNNTLGGVQTMAPSSDDQSVVRSVNGSYSGDINRHSNTQRVTNGKGNNFPVPSSDFHGVRGPENASTRSEGMVESWICSSD